MPAITDLRPSPIAGRWYEGNARLLALQVENFMEEAQLPALAGEVVGLVAPHAGYIYCGRTAGHAFRAVQGNTFDLVVVASPLHAFHPAALLTSAHQAYQTPLGAVPIHAEALAEFAEAMTREGMPPPAAVARDGEHALEIELPFLQRALVGGFRLLPLMVRSHAPDLLQRAGAALAEVCSKRRSLLVASTDLSHFYTQNQAQQLDSTLLRQIEAFSPAGVLQAELSGTGMACGAGALALVLWAAQGLGASQAHVLHYSTSADETGDKTQVVGYGAAAILKRAG